MIISQELVDRFLSNECSREEAAFITAYFETHPQELEKYIHETEWNQFTTQQSMPEEEEQRIWNNIQEEAALTPVVSIHRNKWRYVAAAAVLLFIAGSTAWLYRRGSSNNTIAVTQPAAATQLATITNNTTHNKDITLEDGTAVTMAAHSTLHYPKPFQQHRSIQLEGKAFFNVAKDAAHPFSVTAGGLTTTALGTSFWIEASHNRNRVNIRLVTGKVLIQKDTTAGTFAFQPVTLTPGQQLDFDKDHQQATVSQSVKAAGTEKADNATVKEHKPQQALAFNQQPLSEVLETLQDHYKVTIRFDKDKLSRIKFSGSYTEKDNIDDILNTIALLNELKLEKTDAGYNINP